MENYIITKDGIEYSLYRFNELKINNIFLKGKIIIPSKIYVNNNILYVRKFTNEFYDNIKNKNITYFEVKNIDNYQFFHSIDGIIYNSFYELLAVPPQLKVFEVYLPEELSWLCVYPFNINPYIKRLYITKNILRNYHFILDGFNENYKYVTEFCYKNKIIKKINNSWKII